MTPAAQLTKLFDDVIKSAIPEAGLSVSKWAASNRYVSSERSARPGLWSNDLLPFLVDIMDAYSDPRVHTIVLMKSSQIGGSEFINNCIGYDIHTNPGPLMYIAETEDKAKAWKVESFDPMVAVTPVLSARVSDAGATSKENNYRNSKFPGGRLNVAYATSPAQLSSRPVRSIFPDEVDAYRSTSDEGDPVKLAEARTKTFNETRKIVLVSSPRLKDSSIILREYERSDRREYYVPCPHCDEMQVLRWTSEDERDEDGHVVRKGGYRVLDDSGTCEAYYACINGCQIDHGEKEWMLSRGEWRAHGEFKGIAGFRINELYSPFTTWQDMLDDFREAVKRKDTLQVFINTRLGEPFEELVQAIDLTDTDARSREEYDAPVPTGVLLLTAGTDVQNDRIEVYTKGWGRDHESWSVQYHVIWGDPGRPEVWEDLSDHLLTELETANGAMMKISHVCIDSSNGNHASMVYKFCRANAGRRWYAIKGLSTPGKPIISKPTKQGNPPVKLFGIGTDTAKDEIYSALRVTEPGAPGFCHFTAHNTRDYFRQLYSEKKVTKYVAGIPRQVYLPISQGIRNEVLDCWVYAIAARAIANPNYKALAKRRAVIRAEHHAHENPFGDKWMVFTGTNFEEVEKFCGGDTGTDAKGELVVATTSGAVLLRPGYHILKTGSGRILAGPYPKQLVKEDENVQTNTQASPAQKTSPPQRPRKRIFKAKGLKGW